MKFIPTILVVFLVALSFLSCEETTYVTDCGCDTTTVIRDTTIDRFVIDTVTTFATGFSRPATIVFDAAGNLLVTNFLDPGTIDKVTPAGAVSVFAPGPGRAVAGLAIDPAGYVYGSYVDMTVKKIPPTGGSPQTFISNLANPSGIAFDGAGNLYVAEHEADRISVYSPGGILLKTITAGISGPVGILWHRGALFVANRFAQNVVRIDSAGGMSVVFTADVPLHTLHFDASDNLFMSATGLLPSHKVYVLTTTGVASILGYDFASPVGLATDGQGRLYVANYGNGSISKVYWR
jgi:glucose/arabinose dehydrogenase